MRRALSGRINKQAMPALQAVAAPAIAPEQMPRSGEAVERLQPAPADGERPKRAARPPLKQAFRALRNPNYRLFWFGQVVSMVGTWMQRVGQAWLVLRLTDSPLALGIVTACQTLPVLLLALVGGVIADRVPKRRLLVITQIVMLVQATVLATLTAVGAANSLIDPLHSRGGARHRHRDR